MGEEKEDQDQKVRKRVRTGCLKCRQRRRKCDEGKPKCGSCIEKGFECRYSLQLSFHKDKAFTIRPEEAPPTGSLNRYDKVKFVGDQSQKADSTQEGRKKRRKPTGVDDLSPSLKVKTPLVASPVAQSRPQSAKGSGPVSLCELDHGRFVNVDSFDEHLPKHNEQTPIDVRARDASAIDALLALSGPIIGTSNANSASASVTNGGAPREGPTDAGEEDSHVPPKLNREDGAKLFSRFIYDVAPWLDIYELDQPFGVQVSALARNCSPLHSSILRVAAIASGSELSQLDAIDGRASVKTEQGATTSDAKLSPQRQAEEVLYMLQGFMVEGFRSRRFQQGGFVDAEDTSHSDILRATLMWAGFVLQLGSALSNGTPISIPQSMVSRSSTLNLSGQDVRYRLKAHARDLCWLCARAVNLKHAIQSDSGATHLRGDLLLDTWKEMWEALQWWFESRPYEIYPALETFLNPMDVFPTIIFTTPCASFCTQLFHTALLLLLQCKPRTMRVVEHFPGAVSQLWNARRICSIAISNDTREKWHPTLWSSFMKAACYVTDFIEQQAVLHHAQHVLSVTRWNLQSDIDLLQAHWESCKG